MTSKAAELASEETEGNAIGPKFRCAGSGDLFAAVPAASRGRSPGPEGYVLEEIKPGIFWISAGGYDTIFMPTGEGVVVVDAPPAIGQHMLNAIRSKTAEPIEYVIYSHSHFDHIGAADLYPETAIRIANTDMYLTCPLVYKRFWLAQCAGSRTDGMPTVDQSDMRGLGTA